MPRYTVITVILSKAVITYSSTPRRICYRVNIKTSANLNPVSPPLWCLIDFFQILQNNRTTKHKKLFIRYTSICQLISLRNKHEMEQKLMTTCTMCSRRHENYKIDFRSRFMHRSRLLFPLSFTFYNVLLYHFLVYYFFSTYSS